MTGVITSLPPLVEQPPGNNANNPAGLPGVTYTAAIPNLPQTWTGLQTFKNGSMQFSGSTSGNTFLNATAIASGVLTLPAATDTLVGQNTTDTLTNKTLTNPTINGGTISGTLTGGTYSGVTITGSTITTSTYNGNTWTAGTGVLTIAALKTLTANNTLTLAGTDGTTMTFPATSATIARTDAANTFTGIQTFSSIISGSINGNAATVTTNANLTGDVTSVGNATTLAAGNAGNLNSGTLLAARMPAHTGDVASTAGSVALTIQPNAVTNAKMATMAAWTFKANNTSGAAIPTDITIDGLTLKASPAAGDEVIIWDVAGAALKKSTVSGIGASAGVASINGQTGALTSFFPPQGRLALVTGTPVMTATTTGNGTVYYTPYVGNMVLIYDGTNIIPTVFAELSQATTDTTKSPAATVLNSNYDIFVWNDAGTIRATRGPAWTSSTARGAGAGTTELVRVNGILLNANAVTNGPAAQRGTYVGTVRTRAADGLIDWNLGGAASGGTAGMLGVWNAYNRVNAAAVVTDSGTSYTYTTGTTRQARASAGMQVSFVIGLQEDAVSASYATRSTTTATGSAAGGNGIGLDSTSAYSFSSNLFMTPSAFALQFGATNSGQWNVGIGSHFVAALENSDGTNANTFNTASNNTLSVGVRM